MMDSHQNLDKKQTHLVLLKRFAAARAVLNFLPKVAGVGQVDDKGEHHRVLVHEIIGEVRVGVRGGGHDERSVLSLPLTLGLLAHFAGGLLAVGARGLVA